MITNFARCTSKILPERRGKCAAVIDGFVGATVSDVGDVTTAKSRLLMSHLLSWQWLRHSLGDEAAENLDYLLACPVGQLRPEQGPARISL